MTEPLLELHDISLSFRRKKTLRELLSFSPRKTPFHALRNISLSLNEGEVLGIIGRNGSGKSTLSRLCAGVYHPDSGTRIVRGKAQLLSLGAGFQNQLTGRENVFINGSFLGLSYPEIEKKFPAIAEFADIGEFINEPVKTYSSGMRSRLAFAIATAIRPDILILDEVMATGDKPFQQKALDRMQNLRELAKAALVVSHSPGTLRKICTRIIWMHQGQCIDSGLPETILDKYNSFWAQKG